MGKISVVINTLNEEKNLPRALASVKSLADEVVVCDMASEDKTREIAKKAGAKVYRYKRSGFVELARNFAIGKATGDWILILDADEELPKGLATRLTKIAQSASRWPKADYLERNSKKPSFYRLPRKNIIFGRWVKHSRWWPDYNIRFFRKGTVSWSEIIHSVPMTKGKGADLTAREENAIIHHHYVSIEQYVERLNRYTTEHAKLRITDGYQFSWKDLIKRPTEEFLSRYFYGQGYKDGLHGLALSGLQAFSEFVLYLKVWQLKDFEEGRLPIKKVIGEMRRSESDVRYWQADTLLKEGGGAVERIKRKLRF